MLAMEHSFGGLNVSSNPLQGLYCMSELLRVVMRHLRWQFACISKTARCHWALISQRKVTDASSLKRKTVLIVSQELVGELDGRVLDAEPNPKTGQMDIFFFPLLTRPESRKRRVRNVGFYEGNHA